MTVPVLHVGFHKCGSTTLQGAFFAQHPDVASLGEPVENDDAWTAVRHALNSLSDDERRHEDLDLDRARELWDRAMGSVPDGKVPVFSKETITHFEYLRGPEDERVAKLLHEIVGPAKIVIVGRNQIRLIESLYLFHTRGPKYLPIEDWIAERAEGALRLYEFNKVGENFARVFGRDNVAIFLLEDLKASPAAFMRKLSEFIGVDPASSEGLLQNERLNKRTSQRYRVYSRLRKRLGLFVPIGRVTPAPLRNAFNRFMMSGAEAKIELPARWAAEFSDYYREDNGKLKTEWGLQPDAHRYPL